METRSVTVTNFERPRSSCDIPGARNAFRPKLPNVPAAGTENAAGLIQLLGVEPPAGVSDTPGTRLGRVEPLIAKFPGTALLRRSMVMLTGKPVCAVPIAVTSKLPRIDRQMPGDFRNRLPAPDRKSTRLNSSHLGISYAVFCLK